MANVGTSIGEGIRAGFSIGVLFVTMNIISTWVLPVVGVKGETISSWSKKKTSEVL